MTDNRYSTPQTASDGRGDGRAGDAQRGEWAEAENQARIEHDIDAISNRATPHGNTGRARTRNTALSRKQMRIVIEPPNKTRVEPMPLAMTAAAGAHQGEDVAREYRPAGRHDQRNGAPNQKSGQRRWLRLGIPFADAARDQARSPPCRDPLRRRRSWSSRLRSARTAAIASGPSAATKKDVGDGKYRLNTPSRAPSVSQ
jgi:hypothetical protein